MHDTIEIGDIVYSKHTGDWGYVTETKIVAQYLLTGRPKHAREIGYRVIWFNDKSSYHRPYWYSHDSLCKRETFEQERYP